jgi:hypothetical protein
MRRVGRSRPGDRRGVVLVAVLALLTLGGALIAGAYAAARASSRATRTARAELVAQAAARRAIARSVAGWSAADDSLAVGAFADRAWSDTATVALDAAESLLRVQRLAPSLFLVAVDVSVPSRRSPIAQRRMRVLLERPASLDTSIVPLPRPIARWASADLY